MDIGATRPLHTGREMPLIGLGTWQLTRDTAATVEEALRLGYPMIDTAGDYGTQPGIGEALHRMGDPDVYLVTKVEEDEDPYEGILGNLDELAVESVDLVVLHRPPADGSGVDLWRALIRAREEGLTRDVGVSNYSIDEIEELADETGETPAVNQIEWTPFGWSPRMLDYCREHEIAIQAYSPLTRAKRLDDERLGAVAARYGRSPAQLLIRWCLQLGVVPLPKANRLDHVRENLAVFDFEISDADMGELNGLNERWSALGMLQYA